LNFAFFKGGSFLYMAAAPQAVDEEETWIGIRLLILAWGMFAPRAVAATLALL
jgi:hypothetical protein